MKSVSITTNVVAMCTDTTLIYVIKFTVYIHNDSFPIKSAFLPPFRIRKRFHSDFLFIFTTDGAYAAGCFISHTDNMKQPAAILVLQYWYTILVIPVFYQYLPVSAILVQILVNTSIPVSSRIFQYLQY